MSNILSLLVLLRGLVYYSWWANNTHKRETRWRGPEQESNHQSFSDFKGDWRVCLARVCPATPRPITALGCGPLAEERTEGKSYKEILRERHENMLKGKGICERRRYTEKESYKEENRRKKWMWRKEYSLRRMAVVHFGWQKKKYILILTFPLHESKTQWEW